MSDWEFVGSLNPNVGGGFPKLMPDRRRLIRAMGDVLPIAGMMGFGAAGTAAGLAGGLGNPLTAGIGGYYGAEVGGMAGEAGKQLLYHAAGEPDVPETGGEAISRIAQAGESAGRAQVFGEGIGAGAQILSAPARASLTEDAAAAMSYAERMGLPASSWAFTKDAVGRGARWLADIVPTGRWIVNSKKYQLVEGVKRILGETIEEATGEPMTGRNLTVAGGTKADTLRATSKQAYQESIELAGGRDVKITAPGTAQLARNIAQEMEAAGWAKEDPFRVHLQHFIRDSNMNAVGDVPATTSHKFIEVFLSGLKRLAGKDVTKNDWAEALHEAATSDISAWNGDIGKKVAEAVVYAKKTWKDQAGFQILWNTVRSATRPGPEPGTELLNPEKFMVNLTKSGTEIRKRFGEQTYNNLLNLAKFMMQAAGEDVPHSVSYGMLAGQAGVTGYKPWLVLPEGAHALFVLSLMKPKGWVKMWLTRGAFPTLPPMAAAAGKAALYEQAGERETMPGAIPWRR